MKKLSTLLVSILFILIILPSCQKETIIESQYDIHIATKVTDRRVDYQFYIVENIGNKSFTSPKYYRTLYLTGYDSSTTSAVRYAIVNEFPECIKPTTKFFRISYITTDD